MKYNLMGQVRTNFRNRLHWVTTQFVWKWKRKCCWGNQPLGLRYCRRRTPPGDERYLFRYYKEDITMVASDGHKLVRYKTLAAKGNERAAFILPKSQLHCSKTFCQKEQGSVTIEFDEQRCVYAR